MAIYDQKTKDLPYLEGEGEWLCRPYCLSHSSLSFSRLSRSLKTQILWVRWLQHTNTKQSTKKHTNIFFTSCVFCVPWLVALPLVPVKQKHSNEGRRRATELTFLPKSKHTYLSFVFLLLDLHLSCFFIRLGCCSRGKKRKKEIFISISL